MSDAADNAGLFRHAALEHAGSRAYGQIIISHTASAWCLALVFSGIALGMVIFLVTASYTRSVAVSGLLVPNSGLLRIVAPSAGVVTAAPVRAGAAVPAGAALLSLAAQRSSATAANTDEALAALLQLRRASLVADLQQLSRQAALRAAATGRRQRELQEECRQLQLQAGLQQRRVALAQQAVQRYADLQARGFVAAVQWQDRQSELLDQQQRLAELERAQSSALRELTSARAELQELPLQSQREQQGAQRNLALLDQELAENALRREWVLRASDAGTVAAITVERGQSVVAGQLLAVIVPAGSLLEAELYATSRAAGRLHGGMPVLLRYQGFPYQKYGQFAGRISEVAGTAVPAAELRGEALSFSARDGEPLYRVRVTLQTQSILVNGARLALKPGALLEASIPLDRRRIILWLLDPLLGLRHRAAE